MLSRNALAAPLAALALAGCGAGAGGETSSSVAPETAKTTVERAAKVRLAAVSVPADARDEGLKTYYTNTATAAKDRQAVALFVLKDEKVAGKVSDLVKGSAPAASKLIVRDNVMVVYAPAGGKDRSRAVARAVKSL